MDATFLGISAFTSLTGLIFYSTAIAATSFHYKILKNVNWVHGMDLVLDESSGTTGDVYFGLKAAAVHVAGSEEVSRLTNPCGNSALCYKCGGDGGKASEAFVAIAIIFSFLSLVIGAARFSNAGEKMTKFLHLVAKTITFGFGVAAFCNYYPCFNQVRHDFGKHGVHYGPGFGLVVAATFFIFIGFIFAAIPSGTAGPRQVPTKDPNQS